MAGGTLLIAVTHTYSESFRDWKITLKKFASTKKRLAVIVVAAVLMLGGGIAYAYWSSTGTGTGSATTGTSVVFTITSTAPTGGLLTPGGPTDSVTFTVINTGTGTQNLSLIKVSVAASGGAPWTSVAGCSASDYTVGTPAITYGQIAPAGTLTGTVSIQMLNLASNQDACKSATVPLYFVAS